MYVLTLNGLLPYRSPVYVSQCSPRALGVIFVWVAAVSRRPGAIFLCVTVVACSSSTSAVTLRCSRNLLFPLQVLFEPSCPSNGALGREAAVFLIQFLVTIVCESWHSFWRLIEKACSRIATFSNCYHWERWQCLVAMYNFKKWLQGAQGSPQDVNRCCKGEVVLTG